MDFRISKGHHQGNNLLQPWTFKTYTICTTRARDSISNSTKPISTKRLISLDNSEELSNSQDSVVWWRWGSLNSEQCLSSNSSQQRTLVLSLKIFIRCSRDQQCTILLFQARPTCSKAQTWQLISINMAEAVLHTSSLWLNSTQCHLSTNLLHTNHNNFSSPSIPLTPLSLIRSLSRSQPKTTIYMEAWSISTT